MNRFRFAPPLAAAAGLAALAPFAAHAQDAAAPAPAAAPPAPVFRDLYSDTWVATDGLGRAVTTAATDGKSDLPAPRENRAVGIFYFLANHVPPTTPISDITQLIAANGPNPSYPPGASWWGQPWLGYYQSNDEAVIRKHLQMLANAGVDVLIFDTTNGPTYPQVYLPLCKVMSEMRAEGNRTPQIAFFSGHGAWNTIYRDFYSKNLYPDLWYRWKGKPLLLVHLEKNDALPDDVTNFFSVRVSWAWTISPWFGDGHDRWPWLDNYPQRFGWHEDSQKPEEVSVCVAQHATTSIGRSSLAQHEPPVDNLRLTPRTADGDCFVQQWEQALKIDPEFVFVTGWNEWTAGRYTQDKDGRFAGMPNPKGAPIFVDEYNEEFSRDIEPEQGRLQDDYYYQFADFVRRYKGARPVPPVTKHTISLKGDFRQWQKVAPEFRDAVGDPVHRDNPGWGGKRYVNQTGRNDIVAAKVTYDANSVYFYVRTKDPLTSPRDPNWMLLFLDTDADAKTGWLGYDFVIDRHVGSDGTTSIERHTGEGYNWQEVGRAKFVTRGSELMLAVPRKLLGVTGDATTLDFKWADNIQQTGEASDFTLNGDAAPDDRFNYRARLGK